MNWLSIYLRKVKSYHMIGWVILVSTVLAVSFVWMISPFFENYTSMDATVLIMILIFVGVFFGGVLLSTKVVWRQYDGHYYCLYVAPIMNYFIVNNQIQSMGGPSKRRYCGQLPDGTEIIATVGFWGEVKFLVLE